MAFMCSLYDHVVVLVATLPTSQLLTACLKHQHRFKGLKCVISGLSLIVGLVWLLCQNCQKHSVTTFLEISLWTVQFGKIMPMKKVVQRKDWAELFSLLEKGYRDPPTFFFNHYFFEWVQSWLQICCFSGMGDRGQWRDGPNWGHIHSNWFMQSPIQLTAVKRGVHIPPHSLLKESNGGWFLSNLLGIQPLPGYCGRSQDGVFTAEWREGGHVKEWATHLYDPWDWLYPFPIPQFRKKYRENKEKKNINRAALGGLGEGWRDRRPHGGFSHTLPGLKPYTPVPL